MQDWFVYYKVPSEAVDAARAQAATLLAAIQSQTGIVGRLLRRCDEPAATSTGATVTVSGSRDWTVMEVYEGVADPQGFELVLESALQATALPQILPAGRRIERFCALTTAHHPSAKPCA